MAVKVCVCVSMWVCTEEYRGPTRVLVALELKLQEVVNPLMWVLGTKPGRSASTVSHCALTCCISHVAAAHHTPYVHQKLFLLIPPLPAPGHTRSYQVCHQDLDLILTLLAPL